MIELSATIAALRAERDGLRRRAEAAEASLATAVEEATALRARVAALETDETGLTELAKSIEDSTAEELSLVWKALGFASWEEAGGKKAHEVVATALEALDVARAERDEAVAALKEIAALDDNGANERLAATGSYGGFDEPGAVMTARAFLAKHGASSNE